MTIRLSRWGNSTGLRLPAALMEAAGLKAGDYVFVRLLDSATSACARRRQARLQALTNVRQLPQRHLRTNRGNTLDARSRNRRFSRADTFAFKIKATDCQVSNQQRAFNRLSLWAPTDPQPTTTLPKCLPDSRHWVLRCE